MRKVLDILERICQVGAVVALVLVVIAVAWQVTARYVTQASTAWAPELAQIAFVWCSLLSIAIGVRHGRHMMIDVWSGVKNVWVQRAITTVAAVIVIGVSATIGYFGYNMLEVAMRRTLPGLGISAGWANLAVPVGFALCVIFALEVWWDEITGMPTPAADDTAAHAPGIG
ncbi:MAG: TRAP transporter small permease [Propioniciclava sp.]